MLKDYGKTYKIAYNVRPIIRYINNPMMSFTVVINGPVANAGSIFNLSSSKGTNVPKDEAKMITAKRAELTVSVSANESCAIKL